MVPTVLNNEKLTVMIAAVQVLMYRYQRGVGNSILCKTRQNYIINTVRYRYLLEWGFRK